MVVIYTSSCEIADNIIITIKINIGYKVLFYLVDLRQRAELWKMSIFGQVKNEILERQKYIDFKMNQHLLLRNLMVANYQRVVEKCIVYEKELAKIRSENARYKFVEKCLMNKVVELTGCSKFAKSLTGSGKDDEEAVLQLEISRII